MNLTIAPRVKEAIAAAQAQGVTVTLASGRMFAAMVPFAQELNIAAPAHLLPRRVGAPCGIARDDLSPGSADRHGAGGRRLARTRGIQVNAFADDRLHVGTMTADAEAYMRLARVEPRS